MLDDSALCPTVPKQRQAFQRDDIHTATICPARLKPPCRVTSSSGAHLEKRRLWGVLIAPSMPKGAPENGLWTRDGVIRGNGFTLIQGRDAWDIGKKQFYDSVISVPNSGKSSGEAEASFGLPALSDSTPSAMPLTLQTFNTSQLPTRALQSPGALPAPCVTGLCVLWVLQRGQEPAAIARPPRFGFAVLQDCREAVLAVIHCKAAFQEPRHSHTRNALKSLPGHGRPLRYTVSSGERGWV